MYGLMGEFIMDNGRITKCMEKELSPGKTGGSTLGGMLMIRNMDMESLLGKVFTLIFNFRSDGRTYKGSWKNGKQHGEGYFYSGDGKDKKGVWDNGTLAKWVE